MFIEPHQIARRLTGKQPALFLGAGACISSGGLKARELASKLKRAFKYEGQIGDDLREVSSFLERRRSRKPLIEAIVKELKPLRPDGSLLALARIDWRAIFTTNYDQLVEHAYKTVGKKLSVVRSNYDYSPTYDGQSTQLFKIHGCISQDVSFGHCAPMILTYRDYDGATKFREDIYDRLRLELSSGPVLFIGHSIQDEDIQSALTEAIRRQHSAGAQGEIFAAFPDIDEDRAGIWMDRGLRGICRATVNEIASAFANQLQQEPSPQAQTAELLPLPPPLEPCTIHIQAQSHRPNPRGLFYGAPATYEDIRRGYTFARDVETELHASKNPIISILGAAGTGKSTLARRLLVEHFSFQAHVFEHRSEIPLVARHWTDFEATLRQANESAVLLLDNCTQYQNQVNRLANGLPTDSSLRLLLTSETASWRVRQKHPRLFSDSQTIVLSVLSHQELAGLLRIVTNTAELRQHVEPAFLQKKYHTQMRQLARRCSADMFVCLKSLFSSESLDDIILNEFAGLDQPYQDIYRLTCALEAAGSSPHRQMILRLSGLAPSMISGSLDVLEGLIHEAERSTSPGVFLWKSRHEVISNIVSTYKYSNPEDLYELLSTAIKTANPTYFEEVKMLRDVCNSDRGIRAIPDDARRIELYQLIAETVPSDNVVRHRLVSELLRTNKLGDADAEISRAIDEIGLDPPLQRYKAKLLLGRAGNPAIQSVDRRAMIDAAITEAQRGIERFPDNKYMYFVLADAVEEWYYETQEHGRVEWVRHELQSAYERLLDPDLTRRIHRLPH